MMMRLTDRAKQVLADWQDWDRRAADLQQRIEQRIKQRQQQATPPAVRQASYTTSLRRWWRRHGATQAQTTRLEEVKE